jgi:hypothetical protein
MGLGHWLRRKILGKEAEGDDLPPGSAMWRTATGRDAQKVRSMGEYDRNSYPPELAELIRKREDVASEVLRMDVTSREERIAAIPRLQQLLRTYPHPLVYELLIHAYMDADRFDEAKGVAFAARERRQECLRSPYPEIRAETERLREWSSDEIEALRGNR